MVETQKTKWSIKPTTSKGAVDDLRELVLAWANDRETKKPRYILELTSKERGNKCNCECPSCGAYLTAVNAAKKDYIQRPHFRHPVGAARESCEILTARIAALRMLTELGEILLPSRKVSSLLIGLSGREHTAWIENEPHRTRIISGQFKDFTSAVLTLEDGRILVVKIVGGAEVRAVSKDELTAAVTNDVQIQPTIEIILPDNSFASISPENLRDQLKLIAANGSWICHWDDSNLSRQARLKAEKNAEEELDFPSAEDQWIFDLPPELRRESVLHLEVKRILEKSEQINLPNLHVELQTDFTKDGAIYEVKTHPSEWIEIASVQLEKKIGHTIPDVILTTSKDCFHGEHLLIEVTVTNRIDEERLERIKAVNLPTLEISFFRAGGRVSKKALEDLVVSDVMLKTWIHHPWLDHQKNIASENLKTLPEELEDTTGEAGELIFIEEIANKKPVEEWSAECLQHFQQCSILGNKITNANESLELEIIRKKLKIATQAIAYYGYPEAKEIINSHPLTGILQKLCSIKLNIGVGYKYESNVAIQILNLARSSTTKNKAWVSLYLIAAKVYEVTVAKIEWFEPWRERVKASIKNGAPDYLRDPRYDRLLILLFPEMGSSIKMDFGKKAATPKILTR